MNHVIVVAVGSAVLLTCSLFLRSSKLARLPLLSSIQGSVMAGKLGFLSLNGGT